MKSMFNETTVLPHNPLQTSPCVLHNFSIQVFRKRAAQLHYVAALHFLASLNICVIRRTTPVSRKRITYQTEYVGINMVIRVTVYTYLRV